MGDKDKKHMKKVNAMKDEDAKKKKVVEDEEKGMKETMKANAKALKAKNAKKAPKDDGDDKKEAPDQATPNNQKMKPTPSASGPSAAGSAPGSAPIQYVAGGASSEEVTALKDEIAALRDKVAAQEAKLDECAQFMEEEKKGRLKRRLVVGTGASIHDLFENFLLSTIGMPHYLARFKTAGANDIRMVEHFDVPFLKETIGVSNKLEGKLLVKFIGKFNEETQLFREWLNRQNVMRAYVNTFESKGIITWGILSDYCETIEAVQDAFRIKNKAHAHFLYTQLERYRNGELSDAALGDESSSEDETDSEED